MKIKYLIILFLNFSLGYAQQVHINGTIEDGKSGAPIASATISIAAKKLFYPADNTGKFKIASNKLTTTDSVAFSCIGYQTKKIMVDDMQPNGVIKLSPMVNMLREVRISINMPENIIVGSKEQFKGGTARLKPGTEIAMFMAGSKNISGIIQTVSFFVSNGHSVAKGGNATAPFRIRLYEVDTSGAPGKELSNDVIVVAAKKNEAWFDVDLSAYHIENPDSGFFVAFCLLDADYYKIKGGYQDSQVHIYHNLASPRLATHQDKLEGCRSYLGEETMFGWEWYKDAWGNNYMIHAAIAPE